MKRQHFLMILRILYVWLSVLIINDGRVHGFSVQKFYGFSSSSYSTPTTTTTTASPIYSTNVDINETRTNEESITSLASSSTTTSTTTITSSSTTSTTTSGSSNTRTNNKNININNNENIKTKQRRKILASKSKIFATIDSLIEARNAVRCDVQTVTSTSDVATSNVSSMVDDNQRTMGILGDSTISGSEALFSQNVFNNINNEDDNRSLVGKTLIPPKAILTKTSLVSDNSLKDHISVSIATEDNDAEIANLRLSVYSAYNIYADNEKKEWIDMYCNVINERRSKGALCLCACVNYVADGCRGSDSDNDSEENYYDGIEDKLDVQKWTIGTLECSMHEFMGTELGMRRPYGSLLYITSVAVSPKTRRSGAGRLLLKGVDQLAERREIETVYLHVDVTNIAACSLYQQAGYEIVDPIDSIYAQFTKILNLHDGATKGRKHHLMAKTFTKNQTWYELPHVSSIYNRGTLGFDIFDP